MRNFVVLDENDERRVAIYRLLAQSNRVIPIANLSELGSVWPENAWFLAFDDGHALGDLQQAFTQRGCFHPIFMYQENFTTSDVIEAIFGGAVNYLQWPFAESEIRFRNEAIANQAMRRCDAGARRNLSAKKLQTLSAREIEVLRAIRNGLTSKEVALELAISHRTVEIHRAKALSKLGVRNAIEAARLMIEAEDEIVEYDVAA